MSNVRTQNELYRAVGRIEARLDDVHDCVKDHGPRIRKLENWRWYILGIFAAASAIVTGGFVLL
jgi:hypothetical protein